jgi:hypothetical protein
MADQDEHPEAMEHDQQDEDEQEDEDSEEIVRAPAKRGAVVAPHERFSSNKSWPEYFELFQVHCWTRDVPKDKQVGLAYTIPMEVCTV